jgi:hypothetical protein
VYDAAHRDPGFGGWYLARGNVVAYMKSTSPVDSAQVRKTLYEEYAARPEEYVRKAMAPAYRAEIKPGEFSLSELVAIENQVLSDGARVPGFAGIGTLIDRNRVMVGFRDRETFCESMAAIASRGIPMGAIVPRIMGEIRLMSR